MRSAKQQGAESRTQAKVFGRGLGEAFLQKGSPSGFDAARRELHRSVMENLFKKGFSKPIPKLFDLPLLRNGLRCFIMNHSDAKTIRLLFRDS